MMKEMPAVTAFNDGSKAWEKSFETFSVTTYIPVTNLPAEVINFGFRAPYLMIFAEEKMSMEAAKQFAEEKGYAAIASKFAGSVNFFFPASGSWETAPESMYADILDESRISQYYKDGAALMYDRFAKKMGDFAIRGGVHRTALYGFGASADFIAKNYLKTIEGQGLWGRSDVTPACVILSGLSVQPIVERNDIPVVSVGNSDEINDYLNEKTDYLMVEETADPEKDYDLFVGTFRRMVGNLEQEADLNEMGMVMEPCVATVKTSKDNRGDDKETTEHKIGYVAYYNKGIMDNGKKVPMLFCFHGGGDSAITMASISGWFKVAADHDFLLISIDNHLNSTATEMMELLGQLKEKYNIDSEKIYASGFSMGGCKSWDMYQEYPEVFAALAPMDATFEVGLNSSGEPAPCEINRGTIVPVFYVGGEITPLPELTFQEVKCFNRMKYVLEINKATQPFNIEFDKQDEWPDKIWGLKGDYIYKAKDETKDSILTMNLFESEGGKVYSIFAGVSGQGHEVRHHSCEHAWLFMNSFKRLGDGTLVGGDTEDIKKLYAK